ncbi:SHOCT domain-containing protein [Bacillus salitolerans]|uniref:SHOCT domain-containing protein n=1 Tax=Bacillus salitolerans TaxID=1437434 RepID=A0ABW4LNK5_9BACI
MGLGMMLNLLFWIVVVGLSIYGFLILIMKPFERRKDTSIIILKERFARGEIEKDEYEEKVGILSK